MEPEKTLFCMECGGKAHLLSHRPADDPFQAGDSAAFNEMILKTHKLFPLSTFGIAVGPDGRDYYEMFGSLSAGSILETVIFEIETLADNAMQAAEAYQSELKNVA